MNKKRQKGRHAITTAVSLVAMKDITTHQDSKVVKMTTFPLETIENFDIE